jgi:urease accessory protein
MLRAQRIAFDGPRPYDVVVLTSDERYLRRRVLTLQHGDQVLVDLGQATPLAHGARLVLDDGRHVEVIAAEEPLMEAVAASAVDLARWAWHLGNRHARLEIDVDRLRLQPDHVLRDMLERMGAQVRDVNSPFQPEEPGPMIGHRPHAH